MLQVIAALPRLRSLKLIGSNVSDGGFDCLADCRHLEELSIWSVSPVNGIDHIAKCATLERLRISDSNLFDADFVPLAKLRQLRYLSLSSSRITDAVIDTVAMLPRWKS